MLALENEGMLSLEAALPVAVCLTVGESQKNVYW